MFDKIEMVMFRSFYVFVEPRSTFSNIWFSVWHVYRLWCCGCGCRYFWIVYCIQLPEAWFEDPTLRTGRCFHQFQLSPNVISVWTRSHKRKFSRKKSNHSLRSHWSWICWPCWRRIWTNFRIGESSWGKAVEVGTPSHLLGYISINSEKLAFCGSPLETKLRKFTATWSRKTSNMKFWKGLMSRNVIHNSNWMTSGMHWLIQWVVLSMQMNGSILSELVFHHLNCLTCTISGWFQNTLLQDRERIFSHLEQEETLYVNRNKARYTTKNGKFTLGCWITKFLPDVKFDIEVLHINWTMYNNCCIFSRSVSQSVTGKLKMRRNPIYSMMSIIQLSLPKKWNWKYSIILCQIMTIRELSRYSTSVSRKNEF